MDDQDHTQQSLKSSFYNDLSINQLNIFIYTITNQ